MELLDDEAWQKDQGTMLMWSFGLLRQQIAGSDLERRVACLPGVADVTAILGQFCKPVVRLGREDKPG